MMDRPRKPEVLAPAGSMPSLLAALAHGADAVYFGLQDGFNARARAANFALANLPELCARIHRAGARAYVTLNTLVFEPELPALEQVLRGIAAAGVDALIVQDPAVCLLARAVCPELELHASTQMTIAEAAAARLRWGSVVRASSCRANCRSTRFARSRPAPRRTRSVRARGPVRIVERSVPHE
jgi:putative protease